MTDDPLRDINAAMNAIWDDPTPLPAGTVVHIEGERYVAADESYAIAFDAGHVAPDGSIWLTPESRALAGVVQIPESELEKAQKFGWTETASRACGYVHVIRAHP